MVAKSPRSSLNKEIQSPSAKASEKTLPRRRIKAQVNVAASSKAKDSAKTVNAEQTNLSKTKQPPVEVSGGCAEKSPTKELPRRRVKAVVNVAAAAKTSKEVPTVVAEGQKKREAANAKSSSPKKSSKRVRVVTDEVEEVVEVIAEQRKSPKKSPSPRKKTKKAEAVDKNQEQAINGGEEVSVEDAVEKSPSPAKKTKKKSKKSDKQNEDDEDKATGRVEEEDEYFACELGCGDRVRFALAIMRQQHHCCMHPKTMMSDANEEV